MTKLLQDLPAARKASAEAQAKVKAENANTEFSWRPIGHAPQDDTVVDLWRPSWGGERCVDMRRVDLGKGNVFYEPVLAGPCVVRDATHFMIVRPPKESL